MTVVLELQQHRDRLGCKGPRAEEWLIANGITLPMTPNTWTLSDGPRAAAALLVARLGATEFFLESAASAASLAGITTALGDAPPGVYPVAREDWGFYLGGDEVHEVLAQVCNVNFAALRLDAHPLIMTLMIGIAALVIPQDERQYRIWCDPTFGPYLSTSLGAVVLECGGSYTGVSG
jgi:sarcosine oxidase subunit gamma